MRPRLLPTLALCSLACCLLLCGLWGRSYGRVILSGYTGSRGTTAGFVWSNGSLQISLQRGGRGRPAGLFWFTSPANVDPASAVSGLALFRRYRGPIVDGTSLVAVTFPVWVPVGVTLVPPAVWWRRRRRQGAPGFPVEVTADA